MKIFKQIRLLLFAAIILNLFIILSTLNSSTTNLKHFKAHMVEYANFVLKTLEGGNRIFMMNMGFSRYNLKRLAEEIAKNDNIKNLIVLGAKGEIVFSLKEPQQKQLELIKNKVEETNNELIIHKLMKVQPMARRGMMRDFNEKLRKDIKLDAFIIIDLKAYNAIKHRVFVNLFFIILTEVLLVIIAFSLFKIFKNYVKTQESMKKIEKDAELGKFANILAHEIKNPLSAMKGLIEFTEKKENDEKLKEYLTRSLEEIDRLNKIVNDFLSFGRSISLTKTDLNIKSLIEETLTILKYDYEQKKLSIQIEGDNFHVYGDKDKLFQVFINLLINAISASPFEDRITINIDKIGKKILIQNNVENPDFAVDKIFEPFYTTKIKGSGLGLAICKKIIELHEGSIYVKSTNPFVIVVNFGNADE